MKPLFSTVIFLCLLSAVCQAQDSPHNTSPKPLTQKNPYDLSQTYTKEFYLEKESKLNTAAWVLLSAGTVMGITGTIIYEHAIHNENWDEVGNTFGGVFLIVAGSAMVVTSIPIFIRSGYYKKKALNMSANLKFEPYQSGLAMKHYPAIGISISL
jgi:hypothetical protein